jgi:hypothetical protein
MCPALSTARGTGASFSKDKAGAKIVHAILLAVDSHFLLLNGQRNCWRCAHEKPARERCGLVVVANAAKSAASPMIKMNLWLRELN